MGFSLWQEINNFNIGSQSVLLRSKPMSPVPVLKLLLMHGTGKEFDHELVLIERKSCHNYGSKLWHTVVVYENHYS